ncbi:MarR family transcriptional regulator [Sphingomonas sp. So64.6b]|uniref:winged helix DNA-binding protein n=1 Tax=Sphingomonas sp. So64.6b TaxID=2997354 RepID=UPI0016038A1F|nr:winged helix DNA-binding protein [Sphingomonas sp. So64.6b]QNA86173.1 MarR family transcriptional regulator [Sphingomonas sp. So64.6b]
MALQPKEAEGFEPFLRASTLAMKRSLVTVSADDDEHELLTIAKHLYSARRRRAKAFAAYSMAFHEPPWDMLLDLYVARMERRMVSATSACIAADVPTTSGLRWISTLRQRGLVDLSSDPADGRRTIVRLSDRATETMERYLESL